MHSFRIGGSLSESHAGTAVDEIAKLGGWEIASMAEQYIGLTTGAANKAKSRILDSNFTAGDQPVVCRVYSKVCRLIRALVT